jgi:glycosyltransferase involved in cell wall biosynthesis
MTWICCQLGAREHYAIPRGLHRRAALDCLVTDIWLRPRSLTAMLTSGLGDRFHQDLVNETVYQSNRSALRLEALARIRRVTGWSLIRQRNEWFQQHAVSHLRRASKVSKTKAATLFAYSYAACRLLRFARERGWRTVLGQIDPGLPEERIVAKLYDENPAQRGNWQPAPSAYWDEWRDECALADRIVVNSFWSRDALVREGVPAERIRVVPLAYETPTGARRFERHYPGAFTAERPMRILFLGQINLRKGVGPLLEAARLMGGEPMEFWFVGAMQIVLPDELLRTAHVRWFGAIPRGEVAKYFRAADVFVVPTFSDGFGLTQLEAQAWKLPVIASRFCGDVVRDGINGVLLSEVSAEAIASVLLALVHNPSKLREMAAYSGIDERFSLSALGSSLLGL